MKMITSAGDYAALAACDTKEAQRVLSDARVVEDIWRAVLQEHPELKRTVTLNKRLPASILLTLAADDDPLVRADIAGKRTLPEGLLESLARDRNEAVRARVAWNPRTPIRVLNTLAQDPAQIVAEPARQRLQASLPEREQGTTSSDVDF